jgi:predicted extracellular nuclease
MGEPMSALRIATFNLENLSLTREDERDPTLAERIEVLKPALERLEADVLCLQEIHGHRDGEDGPWNLTALDRLLEGTRYQGWARAATWKDNDPEQGVLHKRNLVTVSRFEITEQQQYLNDLTPAPWWRPITAKDPNTGKRPDGRDYSWERPVLRTRHDLGDGRALETINLHLKSKLPTKVPGQQETWYRWKTARGWAEGYYISSIKRVGQAIEVRALLDQIFEADPKAWIAVCGDLNADVESVPVRAIRGEVEDHGNPDLIGQVMVACERTVPDSKRFTLYHHGDGEMIDHILVSRPMIAHYRDTQVHNELIHDESVAHAYDSKFPESDHAPVVAHFDLPDGPDG